MLVWLLLLLYLPALGSDLWALRHGRSGDLPSFYEAARNAFVERESPYADARDAEAEQRLEQRVHPFLYPPPSLLVLAPLALVSYDTARTALLILNHALFLALVLLLSRPREWRGLADLFPFVYLLVFEPVRTTIALGQLNLLALALVVLAWEALRRGRSPSAVALPLSIAIVVKTYPVLLLAPLVAYRRWREVRWTLALLAGALVLAVLVLPASVWRDWVEQVLPSGGYGRSPRGLFSPAAPWNQSLNGFAARLFLENEFSAPLATSPLAARLVPALLASALVAVVGACSLRAGARADRERFLDLELALWLVVMFAVAPLSWQHHLVFALPACVLALRLAFERGPWTRAAVVLAALVLAWGLPTDVGDLKRGPLTLLISIELYALLVVGGFLLAMHRRSCREAAPRARLAA